nr:hypothetical protein CFP56_31588 [Quercus suber]
MTSSSTSLIRFEASQTILDEKIGETINIILFGPLDTVALFIRLTHHQQTSKCRSDGVTCQVAQTPLNAIVEAIDESDAFFAADDSAKEDHLQVFLKKINIEALIAVASRHREGLPCNLPAVRPQNGGTDLTIDSRLVADQMGGQNCHLDIYFEDGVVWIARLRLEEPTVPPLETQRMLFSSEVDTLRFLARTKVPVPKVYYHTFERSVIGAPFVLMEKISGKPLDWSRATAQQRTKVMQQLVDVFLELERYPLPATGSLSSEFGLVGPFAQTRMFSTASQSIGPFDTLDKSLTSISKHEIELIESGEVSTLAIDNYLTHLWRLENVPNLTKDVSDTSFYIKHFDDKGDHILVDEHHNITGIIDWEFASAESRPVAFSSPCMMWPVGDFYDGSNQLSTEEVEFADMFRQRGREDMAQLVLKGRKYQRYLFFLGGMASTQREEFEALFQGLRKAVDEQCTEPYSEWRDAAIAKVSQRDPVYKRLVRAEQKAEKSRS